ncbi:MAG TPA: LysR substrate-binding domain-containing protein, partial [Burkholderiaceae bacterium]|nr:LysR substrate-binding domain-containing protein [Burkholderiaceae bacterium]
MIDKSDQLLRLTLRQLEVFVATARSGSTRAAAGRVARSQSAASAALAELEATLGALLFDRVGRRLVLNENGRALLVHAVGIVEQAHAAQTLFAMPHAAPLRIAASFTIGEYLLPRLVSDWRATHPEAHVRLDIANTSDVLDAVGAFDVDLGFIEGARTHPGFVVQRWRDDELTVVAAPGHPLAPRCSL